MRAARGKRAGYQFIKSAGLVASCYCAHVLSIKTHLVTLWGLHRGPKKYITALVSNNDTFIVKNIIALGYTYNLPPKLSLQNFGVLALEVHLCLCCV